MYRTVSCFATQMVGCPIVGCNKVIGTSRPVPIDCLFPEIRANDVGVSATFVPHAELEGQPGWVQGGFVATVLDYVCACAATETFGAQAITGTLTVRYSSPVLIEGGPYEVKAAVASGSSAAVRVDARRTLRIDGWVINPDGERVVTASGLFVRGVSTP